MGADKAHVLQSQLHCLGCLLCWSLVCLQSSQVRIYGSVKFQKLQTCASGAASAPTLPWWVAPSVILGRYTANQLCFSLIGTMRDYEILPGFNLGLPYLPVISYTSLFKVEG